jgi:hypothetical protein
MTQSPNPTDGRNFDSTPGDVLTRLEEMLATTPGSALASRPMKRTLLEATINEIKRLRAANEELVAWGVALDEKGD